MLLLLVTFLVTGLLAHEGKKASDDHRQAVGKILRDNAAFAAQLYGEQVDVTAASYVRLLYAGTDEALPDIRKPIAFPELLFHPDMQQQCRCNPLPSITNQFAYDYATDSLWLRTGRLSADEAAALKSILRTNPTGRYRGNGWRLSISAEKRGPDNSVVGFIVHQENPTETILDQPRHFAHGFLATDGMLIDMLTPVDTFNALMPNSDTTMDASVRRFAIQVFSNGKPIFNDGNHSNYYFEERVNPEHGALTIRAYIEPDAAPGLAGGTPPVSRLPVILGLVLLATILIAAALFLSKRQGQLAAAREDFVSSVSHELRTPLAQIRMFTETLLLGRVRNDSERRRSLEIIDQEARRLTALVENVLHLSRAARGTARLTPAAADLAPTIREAVDTFSQMPRSRNVEFRCELEDRLVATVDLGALRQIVLNLLENAVKYGPAGQRVGIGLAMFEEHARLWVDDEGPGIPFRERERVFEAFYRTSDHSASSVEGSGIGLAVVRELAVSLGGRAWADDAPGGGARLVVEFPDAYLRAKEATGSWAVA